jgi:chemotaxis protein methyltransferase CheR
VSVIAEESARALRQGLSVDDIEVQLLLEGLVQHTGYDFRSYDPSVIKRRIGRALSAENISTISELQGAALHDDACLGRLLATLTKRQLPMFGDPALFRAIKSTIVPTLRTYPFLRIWNVGCSTGEDAYALAILLKEEGIYKRCRIYATDAIRDVVDAARGGVYDAESARDWQHDYAAAGGKRSLSDYLRPEKSGAVIDPELKHNIVFAQHNVVTDAPFNEFHFIFGPGLISQFNRELQTRIHGMLYNSLIRLGFLALGRDDSMAMSPHAQAYRKVETDAAIYRRTS